MTKTQFFGSVLLASFVAAVMMIFLLALHQETPNMTLGSAASTTFSTEKFAGIVLNLASAGNTGTSTTLVNTDSFDRIVTSWKLGCEGVGTSKSGNVGAGLATWQLSIGTTTAFSPGTFSAAAMIANAVTVPTSTSEILLSSSTLQTATSSYPAFWAAGTNLTFYFNATNTAVCTVGVNYIGS